MKRIALIVAAVLNLAFPYLGTYLARGRALPHLLAMAATGAAIGVADVARLFAGRAGLVFLIVVGVAVVATALHSTFLLVSLPTASGSLALRLGVGAASVLAMLAVWSAIGFNP